MSLSPGTRLGPYEILSPLGAGGMGEVYRARDTRLEREVALKVIGKSVLSDEGSRRRFRKEAQALARLNHPNIAQVHDFAREEGVDFLVMELVPGETLSERLGRGPLSEAEVLKAGRELASGLMAAHAEGVVHCDLKPANLRLSKDGTLKILDFGLARLKRPLLTGDVTASLSGAEPGVSGTLPYMAPEQLRAETLDARTDVWGAGAVLHELATGELPFREKVAARLTDASLHADPEPAAARRPELSEGLSAVILKCLAKEPGRRYQSAAELRSDLDRLAGETASAGGTGAKQPPSRARIAGVAAAAAVVVAVGAFLVVKRTAAGRPALPAAPGGGAGASAIGSIAVLPLANLSAGPEDYFADGITEELITELARTGSLRVLSRASTLHYRGSTKSVPEIAKELGVDAVVEGSVQRSGGRVRVAAQLIRASPEEHLWAQSYDGSAEDVFAIRSRVAEDISRKVGRLVPTPASPRHEPPAAAHEAFLLGWSFALEGTREGFEKSIEYFDRAIALDDRYARAFAELAESHAMLAGMEGGRGEHFERARELARRAVELEPDLGEARLREADLKFYWDWDWSQCDSGFRVARDLSPWSADTRVHYALCLDQLGRHDEALREFEHTLEVEPLSVVAHQHRATLLARAGRHAEAIEEFRKVVDLRPADPEARRRLARALLDASRGEEALDVLVEASRLAKEPPEKAAALRGAWTRGGAPALLAEARGQERERLERRLSDLEARARTERVSPIYFARIYARLGNPDKAFDYLDRAWREHASSLATIKADESWEPLRRDPRYAALLRRMNLPAD